MTKFEQFLNHCPMFNYCSLYQSYPKKLYQDFHIDSITSTDKNNIV